MINRQVKKQWEEHPDHIASVLGSSFMSTGLVSQLVVEILLWLVVVLLASSVLHAILCIGTVIFVYFLSDYKCAGHFIFVNSLSHYKCVVYYMRLVACVFVTSSKTVINVCKTD
jgi:hypothetical protein